MLSQSLSSSQSGGFKRRKKGYGYMAQMIRIETIIATLQAMIHGTEDMLDQIALAAAVELLSDMDVEGIKILDDEEIELENKSVN